MIKGESKDETIKRLKKKKKKQLRKRRLIDLSNIKKDKETFKLY